MKKIIGYVMLNGIKIGDITQEEGYTDFWSVLSLPVGGGSTVIACGCGDTPRLALREAIPMTRRMLLKYLDALEKAVANGGKMSIIPANSLPAPALPGKGK
jgi:hypothetical protein